MDRTPQAKAWRCRLIVAVSGHGGATLLPVFQVQSARATVGRRSAAALGQILNSYTVDFGIIVTDRAGRVIANGRPREFRSVGVDCRNAEWFLEAIRSRNGEEFGFQSVHESELARGERVLVYSCGIRDQGDIHGSLIGVLAVVFRFDALAQTVVTNTRISENGAIEKRACITDERGRVLADTAQKQLRETLDFPEFAQMLSSPRNYVISHCSRTGKTFCIGHARSPGFEIYATGWHSWVFEEIATPGTDEPAKSP